MAGSAIFKIENSGRRITVDELVAFSQVFGAPVAELLMPLEVALDRELAQLVVKWNEAELGASSAEQVRDEAWSELVTWIAGHPDHEEAVFGALRSTLPEGWAVVSRDKAALMLMADATKARRWAERYADNFEFDDNIRERFIKTMTEAGA